MKHLKKLKIENLALLEKGELFFDKGLNVITGETGAGKSIIVTALSMILGGRADKEYIKYGAKFASIEAEFDINESKPLMIYREFSKEGSSKIKINSKTVTLNELKKTTNPIAEISGQYAGQELMDENNHLNFLDSFGSLESIRDKVSEHYFSWKKTTEELKRVLNNKEQLENERKLLLFQKNEIENAHIKIGEEEKINSELKKLNSARELMSSASAILDILGGEDNSALELIAKSQKELEKMFAIDNKLNSSIELLNEINFQLEDIRSSIEQYGSSIVDNPERMEEINLRLDEIYSLKKKYGGSEEAILKSHDIISDKLTNHPETQGLIDDLTEQRQ
ncbi:MAG: AAA family ATPase, partial [candidate division Zixibacteria bacterium]|nr:AAA family ATPase [candidate division Zixibacteria bacterium]